MTLTNELNETLKNDRAEAIKNGMKVRSRRSYAEWATDFIYKSEKVTNEETEIEWKDTTWSRVLGKYGMKGRVNRNYYSHRVTLDGFPRVGYRFSKYLCRVNCTAKDLVAAIKWISHYYEPIELQAVEVSRDRDIDNHNKELPELLITCLEWHVFIDKNDRRAIGHAIHTEVIGALLAFLAGRKTQVSA